MDLKMLLLLFGFIAVFHVLSVSAKGVVLETQTLTWSDAAKSCASSSSMLWPGRKFRFKQLLAALDVGQQVWLNGWRAVTETSPENDKISSLKVDFAKERKKGARVICSLESFLYDSALVATTGEVAMSMCKNDKAELAELQTEDDVRTVMPKLVEGKTYWIRSIAPKETPLKLCLRGKKMGADIEYEYADCRFEHNFVCLEDADIVPSLFPFIVLRTSNYVEFEEIIQEYVSALQSTTTSSTMLSTSTASSVGTMKTSIKSTSISTTLQPTKLTTSLKPNMSTSTFSSYKSTLPTAFTTWQELTTTTLPSSSTQPTTPTSHIISSVSSAVSSVTSSTQNNTTSSVSTEIAIQQTTPTSQYENTTQLTNTIETVFTESSIPVWVQKVTLEVKSATVMTFEAYNLTSSLHETDVTMMSSASQSIESMYTDVTTTSLDSSQTESPFMNKTLEPSKSVKESSELLPTQTTIEMTPSIQVVSSYTSDKILSSESSLLIVSEASTKDIFATSGETLFQSTQSMFSESDDKLSSSVDVLPRPTLPYMSSITSDIMSSEWSPFTRFQTSSEFIFATSSDKLFQSTPSMGSESDDMLVSSVKDVHPLPPPYEQTSFSPYGQTSFYSVSDFVNTYEDSMTDSSDSKMIYDIFTTREESKKTSALSASESAIFPGSTDQDGTPVMTSASLVVTPVTSSKQLTSTYTGLYTSTIETMSTPRSTEIVSIIYTESQTVTPVTEHAVETDVDDDHTVTVDTDIGGTLDDKDTEDEDDNIGNESADAREAIDGTSEDSDEEVEVGLWVALCILIALVIVAVILAVYLYKRSKRKSKNITSTNGAAAAPGKTVELRDSRSPSRENGQPRDSATFKDNAYDV